MIERGDWDVSQVARNSFDLEGKVVGTIGAGRIGYRVLQRLLPFDCKELLYFDYAPLPEGRILYFQIPLFLLELNIIHFSASLAKMLLLRSLHMIRHSLIYVLTSVFLDGYSPIHVLWDGHHCGANYRTL